MTNGLLARRWFLALLACSSPILAQREEKASDRKLRMQHLTARAVAMREAVRALQERLREQGHSLDPEIVANRARMEAFMDEAEETMKDRRWAEADKAMDRADAVIRKLEAVFHGK